MSFRGKFPPNTMRPPFVGRPSFQPQPRFSIQNRIIFNDGKIDSDIISKLFLLIQEDNFLKLQQFINENGITTNSMIDDSGKSITHIIVESSNLSIPTKKQLLKYLKSIGTMINVKDKTGTTPLHIVCKNQDYELMDDLIYEYNVNQKDNTGKTALHYAVMGVFEKCSSKNPSDNVFEEKPKIETSVEKDDFQQLADEIYNFMINNDNIKKLITHVSTSMGALNEIYKIDIDDIIDKNRDVLQKILTSGELSKEQKIKDTKDKIIISIIDLITKNKLKSVLSPYQINSDTRNGWGPDGIQDNKVLVEADLNDFFNILNNDITRNINIKIDNILRKKPKDLNDYINNIDNITKQYIIINNAMKYLYNSGINTGIYLIYNTTFDILYKLDNDYKNYKVYKESNLNRLQIINLAMYEIEELQDNDIIFNNNIIGDYLRFSNPILELQSIKVIKRIGYILYYQKLLSLHNIYKNITNQIVININKINKRFDYKLLGNTINLIINNILLLQSITNEIFLCYNTLQQILENLTKLIDELGNSRFNGLTGPGGIVLPVQPRQNQIYIELRDYINNNIKLSNIKDYTNNLFLDMKDQYDILNLFIERQNKYNAIIYITQFHTNNYNIRLNNFYDKPLLILPIFFNSFDEFNSKINTTMINNKKKLIERFIPQISNSFNFVYYNDVTNDTSLFIDILRQVSQLSIYKLFNSIFSSFSPPAPPAHPISSKIGYLVELTSGIYKDYDLISGSKSNDLTVLDNANINIKIGSYKVDAPIQIDGINQIYPSIYPYLDEHLKIIKYIILKTVITEINKILTTPTSSSTSSSTSPSKFIKLSNHIRDVLGIDPTSNDRRIFYGMVIKIVDNIYTQYIKDCITLSVNNFTLKPGETYNKPTLQVTAGTKLKLDFTSIKKNFNDEILELFTSIQDTVVNVAEKITKDIKDDTKYKINSRTFIGQKYEDCVRFDKRIVEKLLRNKADLNVQDKDLNTPIVYAIINSNYDCITYLLNDKFSDEETMKPKPLVKKTHNISNKTPLDVLIKLLKDDINLLVTNDFIDGLNKKFTADLISKTGVEKNIRNQDVLVNMLVYLLNAYIYNYGHSYNNGWTNELENMLFIKIGKSAKLKLSLLDSSVVDDLKDITYISLKKTKEDKMIGKNFEDIKKLNEQIKQLNIQKTAYESESNKLNTTEIDAEIKKLNDEKTKLEAERTRLTGQKNLVKPKITAAKLDTTNYPVISFNVVKTFESVINVTINPSKQKNKDHRTYIYLWKNMFKKEEVRKTDNYLLLSQILQNISKIDLATTNINDTIVNYLDLIPKNLLNTYFTEPVYYNIDVNFVLNDILDIIVHIMKNSVFANLYYLILKLLRYHIETLNPGAIDIDTKLDEFIENTELEKYIFEDIPKRCVKRVLEIYENDTDQDKQIDLLELLKGIINKLTTQSYIIIQTDSDIIKKLLNNIFPYFVEYITINAKMMKQITDGYFSILANIIKNIEIHKLLIDKAKKEIH
jgi:ankyrin repeat protein